MSTAALPAASFPVRPFPLGLLSKPALRHAARRNPPRLIRRRPGRTQGMALEAIGHAVEYLVDSRLYLTDEAAGPSDSEAVRILMRLSREVFESCPEVVPVRRRLSTWVARSLFGTAGTTPRCVR